MEELLRDIVQELRADPGFDGRRLEALIHAHSQRLPGDARFAKRQLMPFYLQVREREPERWARWAIDAETERRLLALIQMKPRRTASGVATITVITKPWPCSGNCLFCPSDVRMPKSYLHDEPACQRAERNYFDPYLQVTARLGVLTQMGHAVDKVELIVLGGTWSDYPLPYQIWFAKELFRALNDFRADRAPRGLDEHNPRPHDADHTVKPSKGPANGIRSDEPPLEEGEEERRGRYSREGIGSDPEELAAAVSDIQREVTAGRTSFNTAIAQLYGGGPWKRVAAWQQAELSQLEVEQHRNEEAGCRCVGLVVETRPDLIDPERLALLRRLGCTKIQMGVQSLDQGILDASGRGLATADIREAFSLLRLFGFKTHAHFMVNLPGATPASDRADFRRFVQDPAFRPDEVKLYPCALVASAALNRLYERGEWRPYREEDLVSVLADDVLATPAPTRISRMIRDFSAHDIVAGNKKTNLRQLVEQRVAESGEPVHEIRLREIGVEGADAGQLRLDTLPYRTSSTDEYFLQWVTPEGKIAAFLRLSLPHVDALRQDIPVSPGEAMIREVHVYGKVARLHDAGEGAQHLGLGRKLIEEACSIARKAGYTHLNVISAVGTRAYYRRLDFHDVGLYQRRTL